MGIEQLDVPYLMAPGNHDSSGTVEALRTIPNVIILENGQKFTQNGLTITGKADPVFSPDNGLSKESEKSEEKQLGRDMQGILDEQAANIVVLHNPTAGNEVKTGADLVISGHTHKFKFREGNPDEPLRITAGTSGGAGLRMFDNPYGVETQQDFSILNFSSSCRLISIDQISVTSVSGPPNLRIKHIPVSNSKISTVDQTQSCQ